MFIPVPAYVKDNAPREAIPVANGMLIVANVLAFWMGWSPWWAVGPGSSLLSVVTYAFAHASPWHLIGNMWVLLVFGNPVNRRLGNAYYLMTYFGTVVALGLFASLFADGYLLGSSGAIFAVIGVCVLLLPASLIEVFYLALFPITLIIGLIHRPPHWVFWFIRWDKFEMRAFWAIFLVPLLELWSLFWWGWNWTNLAHLFGLACGVAAVLMLPTQITMRRRAAYASW